jgi:hypothetical protein
MRLSLLSILLLCSTPALAETTDGARLRALIAELDKADKANAALDALVAAKSEALPLLSTEAKQGRSLATRGWAIVGIARIGGSEADRELKSIFESEQKSNLVRSWALAARIDIAPDLDSMIALTTDNPNYPASLTRPVTMRFPRLVAESKLPKPELAERLIRIYMSNGALQPAVTQMAPSMGYEPFLGLMLTAKDQNTRYYAASFASTVGAASPRDFARSVLARFKFDPKAGDVPWAGGPLYSPSLAWEKREATELYRAFLAWYVFAEHRKKEEIATQIFNNLPTFAGLIGVPFNWGDRTPASLLTSFANANGGAAAIKPICDPQPEACAPYLPLKLEAPK